MIAAGKRATAGLAAALRGNITAMTPILAVPLLALGTGIGIVGLILIIIVVVVLLRVL
jgi:phosphoribosylcarboxyaminoimidazole (NCAIR) mutase